MQEVCGLGPTEGAGDGASTLALKPMGRVNLNPKQRVLVAPQSGALSLQKLTKNLVP